MGVSADMYHTGLLMSIHTYQINSWLLLIHALCCCLWCRMCVQMRKKRPRAEFQMFVFHFGGVRIKTKDKLESYMPRFIALAVYNIH